MARCDNCGSGLVLAFPDGSRACCVCRIVVLPTAECEAAVRGDRGTVVSLAAARARRAA